MATRAAEENKQTRAASSWQTRVQDKEWHTEEWHTAAHLQPLTVFGSRTQGCSYPVLLGRKALSPSLGAADAGQLVVPPPVAAAFIPLVPPSGRQGGSWIPVVCLHVHMWQSVGLHLCNTKRSWSRIVLCQLDAFVEYNKKSNSHLSSLEVLFTGATGRDFRSLERPYCPLPSSPPSFSPRHLGGHILWDGKRRGAAFSLDRAVFLQQLWWSPACTTSRSGAGWTSAGGHESGERASCSSGQAACRTGERAVTGARATAEEGGL